MTRAERRLKKFLRDRKLMFLFVGARSSDDRAISTHVEGTNGATVANREYNALIRDIIKTVRDEQ